MSPVLGIDHIAIATHSLKESLDFFENKLGIKCERIEELPDRGIRVAMLPIGDTRIELMEPMKDGSEISAFLEKRGPGIHHIAMAVTDVAKEMRSLRDGGAQLTTLAPSIGAGGHEVGFVHPKSTGGVLVELVSH